MRKWGDAELGKWAWKTANACSRKGDVARWGQVRFGSTILLPIKATCGGESHLHASTREPRRGELSIDPTEQRSAGVPQERSVSVRANIFRSLSSRPPQAAPSGALTTSHHQNYKQGVPYGDLLTTGRRNASQRMECTANRLATIIPIGTGRS